MGKSKGLEGRVFSIFLLSMFCLTCACTQTPTPTIESLQFTVISDTSSAPLMSELIAEFSGERPHVTVNLEQAANAEMALAAAQAGQVDLASVSWLPESEKVEGTLWYRPFARDSIVVITHPSNPVGVLTLQQLRSIFQGQVIFWEELGGSAHDVLPVSREDGSGTRLSFEALVMGRRDVSLTAVVMPSNTAVVEYIAATPGAIGYISSAVLAPSVNLIAVEGVTPSPASVQDGSYLLARPYYLVAPTEPTGGVADFVSWIWDGKGQTIVKRGYGSVP